MYTRIDSSLVLPSNGYLNTSILLRVPSSTSSSKQRKKKKKEVISNILHRQFFPKHWLQHVPLLLLLPLPNWKGKWFLQRCLYSVRIEHNKTWNTVIVSCRCIHVQRGSYVLEGHHLLVSPKLNHRSPMLQDPNYLPSMPTKDEPTMKSRLINEIPKRLKPGTWLQKITKPSNVGQSGWVLTTQVHFICQLCDLSSQFDSGES